MSTHRDRAPHVFQWRVFGVSRRRFRALHDVALSAASRRGLGVTVVAATGRGATWEVAHDPELFPDRADLVVACSQPIDAALSPIRDHYLSTVRDR